MEHEMDTCVELEFIGRLPYTLEVMHLSVLALRIQVPNNHIPTQNLYYN